jgi:hypothetical protein
MRAVWYVLTALLGAYGALALLRAAERAVIGAPQLPLQLVAGVLAVLAAWRCLARAREAGGHGAS